MKCIIDNCFESIRCKNLCKKHYFKKYYNKNKNHIKQLFKERYIENKNEILLIAKERWKQYKKQNNIIDSNIYLKKSYDERFGFEKSKQIKLKQSLKHLGKNNHMYGKTGKNAPRYGKKPGNKRTLLYNNILFASSYEVIFAKWCDKKQYKWIYEPKRFYYEKFTFVPDFWVEELNTYVEIKGWFRNDVDREKIKLFKKNNSLKLILGEEIFKYKF